MPHRPREEHMISDICPDTAVVMGCDLGPNGRCNSDLGRNKEKYRQVTAGFSAA